MGRWEMEYSEIDLKRLLWFCDQQFKYFPNIDEIQVFDAEGDMKYAGSIKRSTTTEWREA